MSNVAEWQQIKGWLDEALAEARLGLAEGGIPIGAVLADPKTNEIVSRGHNLRVQARTASRKTSDQFDNFHENHLAFLCFVVDRRSDGTCGNGGFQKCREEKRLA